MRRWAEISGLGGLFQHLVVMGVSSDPDPKPTVGYRLS